MGLSAEKSLRLKGAGLVGLYDRENELWTKTAKDAFDYTVDYVKKAGEPVRPDDLIPSMLPVLEVTKVLRDFLDEKKLRQKYWYRYFGELIVDRRWSILNPDDNAEEAEK